MDYRKEMDDTDDMQGMEEAGRGTDTVMGHLSLGEVVIPRAFLDDPQVLQAIQAIFSAAGADLAEFTVGDKANKINPETGHPEFFFKSIGKAIGAIARPVAKLATMGGQFIEDKVPFGNVIVPAAATYFGGPALAGAYAGAKNYANTGNFGQSIGKGALTAGTAYAGQALLGGGGGSSLTDNAFGRAINNAYQGSLLQGLRSSVGNAFSDAYQGSALQGLSNGVSGALNDAYTGASGVFDTAASGVDNLYQGSALQSVARSGSDLLKSAGLNTGGGTTATPVASVGSGASSYGGDLGQYASGGAADSFFDPATTALNGASSGVDQVASNYSYLAPLLSAGLGYSANTNAADALRKQQEANLEVLANARNEATGALTQQQLANTALLDQYSKGFSFAPGDLTQDPGYQFQLTEGNRAADRANLARGNYFSGEALREAQQFGQGLADNTYNAAFNRALQGRNAGLQGALAQVGTNSNYGQNLANQAVNYGNSVADVNSGIGEIDAKRTVLNNNLVSGALGSLLGGNSFNNTGALSSAMYSPALEEFLRRNGGGGSYYAR